MNLPLRISLYWTCQLLGWSSAAVYWALTAYLDGGFSIPLAVTHFFLDVLIGIAVTQGYGWFAHRYQWTKLELRQMPWRIIPAIGLTGLGYTLLVLVKNYELRAYFNPHTATSGWAFFRQHGLTLLATGIRLLAIWILAFHLYHYALYQIRTAQENARLLLVAQEAQLNNLSSQLNPHFFFNSLNTVKALVALNPDKARRAIDLLSDLLRTALYGREERLIPLRQEMGLVNDYLELEQIRFDDRLSYEINWDDTLGNQPVLPLSIQTLTENAVKHGIAQHTAGGLLTVELVANGNHVRVTVRNPGNLVEDETARGLGLRNLRERLQLQYGDRASLTLSQLPGPVVSATLLFPKA